jgi:hypothetical protein
MFDEKLNNAWFGKRSSWDEPLIDQKRAHIPHAMTLLFHLLTVVVVVFFSERCLRGRDGALWGIWFAGLVFALHPIHVENVAWIVGRSDILATLFLVAGLYFALLGRDKANYMFFAASSLLYLLALLSKEVALMGLALLPLCLYFISGNSVESDELGKNKSGYLVPLFLYLAVTLLYFNIRVVANPEMGRAYETSVVDYIFRTLTVAGFYIRKIFVPWPLTPLPYKRPEIFETTIALAFWFFVLAISYLRYKKFEKLYVFCLLWFVFACLPAFPVAHRDIAFTPVAERYLYLPSVAFAVAGGCLIAELSKYRRRVYVFLIAGGILAVYGITTWTGSSIWHNYLTLLTRATRQEASRNHPLPWTDLGFYYNSLGNEEEAERCFRRAVADDVLPIPKFRSLSYHGLGDIRRFRAEDAMRQDNLGKAIANFKEAENFYAKAVEVDPKNLLARIHLSLVKMQLLFIEQETSGKVDVAKREKVGEELAEMLRLAEDSAEAPEARVLIELYRSLGGRLNF